MPCLALPCLALLAGCGGSNSDDNLISLSSHLDRCEYRNVDVCTFNCNNDKISYKNDAHIANTCNFNGPLDYNKSVCEKVANLWKKKFFSSLVAKKYSKIQANVTLCETDHMNKKNSAWKKCQKYMNKYKKDKCPCIMIEHVKKCMIKT